MSSSDWLALGGVIVSCLAFAVSFVAYRLQARSAQSDNEKELADQINAIQAQLAELSPVPQPTDSMEALVRTGNAAQQPQAIAAIQKTSSVNGALQTLLLRTGTLVESAKLQPDWYQNLVLATAAVQIGDPITAEPSAERPAGGRPPCTCRRPRRTAGRTSARRRAHAAGQGPGPRNGSHRLSVRRPTSPQRPARARWRPPADR
jgi:type IV secretory pathway VirB10-like protein